MAESLLIRREVERRTGLCCASIYKRMRENKFPKPVHLDPGERAVHWVESEVTAWIAARIGGRA